MQLKEAIKVIDHINKTAPKTGTLEELNNTYLAGIASLLANIAQSLAIIADSSEVGKMLIEQEYEEEGE